MLGGVALKHWSSTQSTVALSVGEAEYTALVRAATEALGMQSAACDFGVNLSIEIGVDSSTAKSIASRSGVGKVRHLETKTLWVQQAVRRKRFLLGKVPGTWNPADVLTKPLSAFEMHEKLGRVGATMVRRERHLRPRWADEAGDQTGDE